MLSLLFLTVAIGNAAAKFAFPVPSYYSTEFFYKSQNSDIKWDPTNLLTDLAGPIALCDRLSEAQWGQTSKKATNDMAEAAWKAQKIDPIFFPERGTYTVYYLVLTGSGADARSVDNDIRNEINKTAIANFKTTQLPQFSDDIKIAARFGCSVEPMCPGTTKTVVVCLFQEPMGPKPFWVFGFNETWNAHAHDIYAKAAESSFQEGAEFPGYVWKEDETVVNNTIGQELCDKWVYEPANFVKAVANYWKAPPEDRRFRYALGTESLTGFLLTFVESSNATSARAVYYAQDSTIPPWFNRNVVSKFLGRDATKTNILATPVPLKELNTGACVVAVCPNRIIPKPGSSSGVGVSPGGKTDRKGNFFAVGCMTFRTNEMMNE
jgi:hypothetical protein